MRELIAVAGIGLALTMSAQAQFTYVTNNGAITITGCTSLAGDVTIPSTINGLPVAGIGNFAFYHCLYCYTIPNSVAGTGQWVFSGCIGLTNAMLGDGLSARSW
jgi:hypothetical protein